MSKYNIIQDQLRLAASAIAFDLTKAEERKRSSDALSDLFHHIQSCLRPKIFVEFGAYEALFSRNIKSMFPNSQSFAFEGNPNIYNHFSKLHDFKAAGVEYRHSLISDSNGFTEMMVQSKWDGDDAPALRGNDSLLVRTHPGVEYEPKKIPSVRLDSFFDKSQFANADFSLWIDVEGAFEKVFDGAQETLKKTKSLLIEVEEFSHWAGQWLYDDVHEALTGLGFVAVARDFEYFNQFNVLYIHDSAMSDHLIRTAITTYLSGIMHTGRKSG
ncbi:FkbM family methyltransferase [Methylobacterium sp. J-043]|nr:FkbM family methyltransferase [Methylobacterium sp. J-043]